MRANSATILVADDDPDLREAVSLLLRENGFMVAEATTGAQARRLFHEVQPDVVLLDLGLPDVAGLDLLVELSSASTIPVIVLSGRSGDNDRAVGLDLGADDYIVKPFAPRELVARVRAALRRVEKSIPTSLSFGSVTLTLATREVTVDGRLVRLTAKEFDVLYFLARSPRQVFTRRQILQQVWGSSPEWQDDGTVAEHVYRIRRKLDPTSRAHWIETVKSVGYRFTGGP